MVPSNNHQGLNCRMKNNENKFGHFNSSIIDFNPDISVKNKHFDEAEGSCRKGKWSPQEDYILTTFVKENGTKKENGKVEVNWGVIACKLNRTYKSCRLRWYNQLAPEISFESFSPEEDDFIIRTVREIGPMWSKIAEMLKCRTDNQVKNRWNSALKKVQSQMMPQKASIKRGTQTLKQGEKSTHGNFNGSSPSHNSSSTLPLISNSTSSGPVDQLSPPGSLPILSPFSPDGSHYCHLSPALDGPDLSTAYASPGHAREFDWLYSPSLHPPGCELPDLYPDAYPQSFAFNPTQETQCASAGGISAMELGAIRCEPEPEKPAGNLPGFDWVNLQ